MEESLLLTKDEKKIFRKEINRLSRTLIYYETSILTVIFVWGFYLFMKEYNASNSIVDNDNLLDSIQLHFGLMYICGISIGMLFIRKYHKKYLSAYTVNIVKSKMNFRRLMTVLAILMSLQLIHMSVFSLMEIVFNFFGYSINVYTESSRASSNTTISMFLYASFLGPISEEIIFRGVVLRKLENHGKLFAIVTSAMLFGISHGNLHQGIFAISVGLILGYVTLEYSIKWSILLHIINNFVFSQLLNLLTRNLSVKLKNVIHFSIFGLFFVTGCVLLIKNKDKIKQYIKENRTKKNIYKYTFTSICLIAYIVLNLMLAIIAIEKIA